MTFNGNLWKGGFLLQMDLLDPGCFSFVPMANSEPDTLGWYAAREAGSRGVYYMALRGKVSKISKLLPNHSSTFLGKPNDFYSPF